MDDAILKLARELAKEIQKDDRYLALELAKQGNDNDKALAELIGKFNLVRININGEMGKKDKDQQRIDTLNQEMRDLYAKIMQNPNMMIFSGAKEAMDQLANQINAILMGAINGEDPDAIDVESAGCGGNCASCGGCGC